MYICPVCKNKDQTQFNLIIDTSEQISCLDQILNNQPYKCEKIKSIKPPIKIECLRCLEKDWEDRFINNVFHQPYLYSYNL